MSPLPIERVIAEAHSRGLVTERLPAESKRHRFDKRLLLISGSRCQVIPTRRGHPSAEYPKAEYFPLYLPRTNWPDFLVYVSLVENPTVFYVIPRMEMTKDTGLTPESLEPYREAWDLLGKNGSIDSAEKSFEVLSWQMEAVNKSANEAGLEVELIETKKHRDGRRWPPVIKRRMLIAGRKCALFSSRRLAKDPQKAEYNYVFFGVPKSEWADFVVYIVRIADSAWDLFVIPKKHLTKSTSASLDHPELVRYKNAWSMVTASPESLSTIPPIQWREPSAPAPPTRHSLLLQEAIREAESHQLPASSAEGDVSSHKGVQSFIYVNMRPCQVLRAKVLTRIVGGKNWSYLALARPKSEWPEFFIFQSLQPDENASPKFYIIPRKALNRASSRSLESPWLREYENAWHQLR